MTLPSSSAPACACCTPQLIPTINAKKRRVGNPLRADPTRTATIRRQFLAEVNRRFKELLTEIKVLLVDEDALGLKNESTRYVANAERRRWQFLTDDKKVEAFRDWLDTRINAKVLSVGRGQDAWTAKYVGSAYKQGIIRAWVDANRELKHLGRDAGFYEGTQAEFLRTAFGGPEAVSKLRLLSTRTYESLRGVTSTMSSQMTRVLADGMSEGRGINYIAKQMADTVTGIPLARARTIARTEIIHAHSEGQLDSFEELGVDELGVMAEWSTAGDDRVCPVCAPLEGVVLTVKEARGMIPRHPNCRCTWIPANVTEKEAKQKRTAGRISSAITRSLKKETNSKTEKRARERSRWVGADRTIRGKGSQYEE